MEFELTDLERSIFELTDLQRKTIETLAKNGPMCGYDFHLGGKKTRGHRKAIMSSGWWLKIRKNLGSEGKKLIVRTYPKRISSSDQRGRRKDLYWLTEEGVVIALSLGVDPNLLLNHMRKYLQKIGDLEIIIECARIFGPRVTRNIYVAIKKGEVPQLPRNERKLKKFFKLLMKYPKYRNAIRAGLKDFRNFIEN